MIAYLSPSYRSYRIPVFEAMSKTDIGQLHVISLDTAEQRLVVARKSPSSYIQHWVKGVRFQLVKQYSVSRTPCTPDVSLQLHGLLRTLKPKIAVSNNLGVWTATCLALGIPTVVFWEGTDHTERTVGVIRKAVRTWVTKRAGAFVVNGSLAKSYLVDHYGVDEHIIFTGGLSSCLPPPTHGSPRCDPLGPPTRFLFVGALTALKGPELLLRAAAILRNRTGCLANPFAITLVGEGKLTGHLRHMIASLRLESTVRLAGACAPDDVWQYYRCHDVFVLPTMRDNWPLVVPEAMSTGLPIILSRRSGNVRDLLVEGENGFGFDPTNADELADRMAVYINSPAVARRHGRASQRLVSPYTPQHAARVTLAAIRRALAETRKCEPRSIA